MTLEEKVAESTKALLQEKAALEEKSTFLHFTQEQLNHQVQTLEQEVSRLKTQVEELKAKLEESEQNLVRYCCLNVHSYHHKPNLQSPSKFYSIKGKPKKTAIFWETV